MRAMTDCSALRYNNCTACWAVGFAGALFLHETILQVSFLIFDQCFGQDKIGGFCIQHSKAVMLNCVLFVRTTTAGDAGHSGAPLTVVNCERSDNHVSRPLMHILGDFRTRELLQAMPAWAAAPTNT
jgi:hypothetical protein